MVYTVILAILAFLSAILDIFFNKEMKPRDYWLIAISFILGVVVVLKECNNDSPKKSDIAKLSDQINPDLAKNITQGFSIYMVLAQKEVSDNRRKYIFDYGQSINKNRISLYFDASNNLMFSIINQNGEPYTCSVPASSYTIIPNIPFFVFMDCGTSPTSSFMRVRINDRVVYESKSQFAIDFIDKSFFDSTRLSMLGLRRLEKPFDFYTDKLFFSRDKKGMVCADLNSENIGKFHMFELMAFGRLLPKDGIEKIWGDISQNSFPFAKRFMELKIIPMETPYEIIDGNFVALPR